MKTAMQELIDWIRITLPMGLDFTMMIESKAENLLEKEKEQIENAFESGYEDCLEDIEKFNTGKEYYKWKFFNQNK